MKIIFSTFQSPDRKAERLYTVQLTPKDTLHILDEPGGWFITEPRTHVQLHLLPCALPPPIPKDKIFFEYRDECYMFVSQTGFKTDEEHLDWLTSQKKIPMLMATNTFGSIKTITLGYVQFEKEIALH